MKKEENAVFKRALAYENSKNWHLAFATQAPREGRRFKFTTLFIHYNVLAKTVIKKVHMAQLIEPGLYLLTNPLGDNQLCVIPKEYKRQHTNIAFAEIPPIQDGSMYLRVLETRNGAPKEVDHLTDTMLVIRRLDVDLYYVTTLAGKAYYIFIRKMK